MNNMNETEDTIKTITAEDGTEYTPCKTSEAEGLWSNGKFIEGNFFRDSIPWFYPTCKSDPSCTWKMLGAIPVKKVVPKKEPLVWRAYAKISARNDVLVLDSTQGPPEWLDDQIVEVRVIREVTEPKPAPELDLSPLTEEEFRWLQIGDVVFFKSTGTEKRVNGVGVNELGEFEFTDLLKWAYREGPWIPTPETARRLGRGVKS
jgi:hypothetical protein